LSFELDEPEISETEKTEAQKKAGAYFALSRSYLTPRRKALIITCGLTGTGKSYSGARLGKRLGCEPLRSDPIRKEILSIPLEKHHLDKFGQGIYTSSATKKTYDALFDRADELFQENQFVVLDASFTNRSHREKALLLARKHNASFRILFIDIDDETVRKQLQQRSLQDPSDGTWEIFLEQKRRFDPIVEAELEMTRTLTSSENVDDFLTSFVRDLISE
jgi:uncharacterized protein